jgi:hypothetical protein
MHDKQHFRTVLAQSSVGNVKRQMFVMAKLHSYSLLESPKAADYQETINAL